MACVETPYLVITLSSPCLPAPTPPPSTAADVCLLLYISFTVVYFFVFFCHGFGYAALRVIDFDWSADRSIGRWKQLFVIGEHDFRVEHCLLALPGTKKEDIKRVMSHPQALAQCDNYLRG